MTVQPAVIFIDTGIVVVAVPADAISGETIATRTSEAPNPRALKVSIGFILISNGFATCSGHLAMASGLFYTRTHMPRLA